MSVFLVFDVECLVLNVWSSISFVIADRTGRVLQTAEFFAETNEPVDDATDRFWKRYPRAYSHNVMCARGRDREAEELKLCEFMATVKQTYKYIALSDTPEFDARIINNVLLRHGHRTISQRDECTYFQCVCAWSFRLSVGKLYGISGKAMRTFLRQHTRTAHGGLCAHTSYFDCLVLLYDHLAILDFIDCAKAHFPMVTTVPVH